METYVTLAKFTAQGISNAKDIIKRAEKAAESAEALGGHLKSILWLQGEYDVITITEFPNAEAQSAWSVGTAMIGNVTTRSMRAFTAQEVESIIKKLP